MTITYQFDVHTSSFFGFAKLLKKWRGSVYKLVYKEMILYVISFGLISFSYRHLMTEPQKRVFEKISLHFARYLDLIPLSFVLGFYVTHVVQRWWSQFNTIPWPDRLMNTIILYVEGVDERGRIIRRTLMRYWNISFVMILSSISIAVKKRFPTLDHLVEAGFMTDEEQQLITQIQNKINKYFVPMCWFLRLLDQAKKEGRVKEGAPMKHILEELNDTRSKMSLLWCHDWVTVPLVYTQVVTWATHLFFVGCLVGRQFLDTKQNYPGHDIDLYVPVFTLLQFFFYMGWLKVAEQLINPFGEDDDDFETNWLIDRHIQVSYLGVDELYNKTPRLEKDLYFNDKEPDVPYTPAALIHRIPTYSGSTMHLKIPDREQHMVHADSGHFEHHPMPQRKNSSWKECIKNAIVCRRRPVFDKRTMWQEMNHADDQVSPINNRKKGLFSPRTLGRKESLMADDFLLMLNAGRRRSRMERVHSQPNGFPHHNDYHHPNDHHHVHLDIGDAVPMIDRKGRHSLNLGRQESVESSFSYRVGGSMSESPSHREDFLLRHPSSHSSRYSFGSDGDEDDGGIHMLLHDGCGKMPLSRLSEVENETDGDYSSTTTPMTSPFASQYSTMNCPEENAQLMAEEDEDEEEENEEVVEQQIERAIRTEKLSS